MGLNYEAITQRRLRELRTALRRTRELVLLLEIRPDIIPEEFMFDEYVGDLDELLVRTEDWLTSEKAF